MPTAVLRRIAVWLVLAAPAVVLRITGTEVAPVLELFVFGTAIIAAAFLLAWAAEAAQKDISRALAIALLALIAVLPEYAVDLCYAFRSGSDPDYLHFAAANMTGSNRGLLGFGWPLLVIIALHVACCMTERNAPSVSATGPESESAARAPERAAPLRAPRSLRLDSGARMDIGFLVILGVPAFAIPLVGRIPMWFGSGLVLVFAFYLWRAGQPARSEEEEFVGAVALIAGMPKTARRATVIALFAVRGMGATAIGTLIASTPGVEVEVVRVSDRSPELLRCLTERGIVIGTLLTVRSVSSAASSIANDIDGEHSELALDTAVAIRVDPQR